MHVKGLLPSNLCLVTLLTAQNNVSNLKDSACNTLRYPVSKQNLLAIMQL